MRLTESRLRRIIKNIIRENIDDMKPMKPMDPMDSIDPMDCKECEILCDEIDHLESDLANRGCEDPESAREFFGLLDRFRREVFEGQGNWKQKENEFKNMYPNDPLLVLDLYHMCVDHDQTDIDYHLMDY